MVCLSLSPKTGNLPEEEALGKIAVEDGREEEKTVFYTALYHTMIDPRVFSDVDGRYPGANGRILQSSTYTRRTIFSGWDVFRSQFPLQTLINPRVVRDMLADAYAKGIRDFDVAKGYLYAQHSVDLFGNGAQGYTGGENSISKTLEYAYSDWCFARLAGLLGKKDDSAVYGKKAFNYRNVFDTSKHWFRPRKEDGSWEPWPAAGRLQQDYGTVESNPYQQGWFIPQDVPGMVRLMGGSEKVRDDLDSMFANTPENMMWNDYYNQANEPVHHIPFLFNRIGYPWLTQKWTRAICARAYHNGVEGLVGNEDVGQMSAWYVLAASGLHPVCPGDARYEITSPVFSRVVIRLDPAYSKGKSFTILARGNSPQNVYIQSAMLNGKPYPHCWLDYKDISAGGILELWMGPAPATGWGI